MRRRRYLVFASLLGLACGSSDRSDIDAPLADLAQDPLIVDASVDAAHSEDASPVDEASPIDAESMFDVGTIPASGCNPVVLESAPPLFLSQTGCFEPDQPGHPVTGFFPYEVNSPLWSDGALKSRFLRVPTGQTINVKDCDREPSLCLPVNQGGTPEDEGHFGLPIGSILIKNFALVGKLIETRILVRASSGAWSAFSYEWNEDSTEATLLSDLKDRAVAGQIWHYPSPRECLQCHTAAAGRTLGPTTRQLDRITLEGDQLDRLVATGWLHARPKALAPYPDPRGAGTIADRARAYLQSNCSFCHRPAGPFSDLDLRYVATLFDMKVCNVSTVRGIVDPNVPPLRLVPGAPEASALSVRMHNRSGYAMPKIGSNLVDPDGVAAVDAWIRDIASCPLAPTE